MVTPFPADAGRIVGGVAGVARYLAPCLAATGEVELLVVAPGSETAGERQEDGFRIRHLEPVPGPGFLGYWSLERRRIRRALDAFRPDLVHVQAVGGWALGCPYPWLLTIHGVGERDVLYSDVPLRRLRAAVMGRVEALARRRASDVICISPYISELLGHQLRGRVWDIENPIDDRFFDVARSEVPGRLVFVGRIGPRKNLLGLLDAFERVAPRFPEAELQVAGDDETPDYAARCRSRVADSDALRGRVHFLGSLPIERVRALLGEASGLVLPSFQETAPLVIEEAMAAGVPALASGVCGMPYMIEDGATGFLFDPSRPDSIADKLAALLGDPELRRRMSERSRAVAEDRFRATRVARRTLDLYHRIAARR
jgi:glycosyltransferase involved in cell wall biosynthesis